MNGNSCEIVPPPQLLSVHQSKHGDSQSPVDDFACKAAALSGVFSKYMCGSVLGYSCTDIRTDYWKRSVCGHQLEGQMPVAALVTGVYQCTPENCAKVSGAI